MARYFDVASSEYLSVTGLSAPWIGHPLSMACWFNPDNITAQHILMSVGYNADNDYWALTATGNVAGDPVRAYTTLAGNAVSASTTTGFSASAWQHACGVWSGITSRAAYLNGGSKGTETSSRDPGSQTDQINIGHTVSASSTSYLTGSIAEAAIWNIALSDAEVALLAKPVSPFMVHPESIVFYLPMIRDEDRDLVNGSVMTVNGTPLITVHPRIFYLPRAVIPSLAAGAAPGSTARSYGIIFG